MPRHWLREASKQGRTEGGGGGRGVCPLQLFDPHGPVEVQQPPANSPTHSGDFFVCWGIGEYRQECHLRPKNTMGKKGIIPYVPSPLARQISGCGIVSMNGTLPFYSVPCHIFRIFLVSIIKNKLIVVTRIINIFSRWALFKQRRITS